MSLSKYAQKLRSWFGIYSLTATEYERRQAAVYSSNHYASYTGFATVPKPVKRGLFRTVMQELLDGGY